MAPYLGEIRMFAGNFAPAGWAFCDGRTLAISENDALFTLIGTTYGGDGQETFNLPNLQSRLPMHFSGSHPLAETAGTEQVTLTVNQVPAHAHPQVGSGNNAGETAPGGNVLGVAASDIYVTGGPFVALAPAAVSPTGGSQPHENMQPFLCISFIISLFGIFPQQT